MFKNKLFLNNFFQLLKELIQKSLQIKFLSLYKSTKTCLSTIKNILKNLLQTKVRNSYEENKAELKNTRWVAEGIKALPTVLLTIIITHFIRQSASGNLQGIELENYLSEQILERIKTEDIKNTILYNGTYNILSDEKVIIVYSKYITPENQNMQNYYDGACLSIFERKNQNIIHEYLDIPSSYELTFCANYEGLPMYLNYLDFEYDDYDNDGITDFHLITQSDYATHFSREMIFIGKNQGVWTIITPNIENIVNIIHESTNKKVIILYNLSNMEFEEIDNNLHIEVSASIFTFNDLFIPNKQYNILGVTENGSIYSSQNPFNSAYEILYQFPCRYIDWQTMEYLTPENENLYIMQQFNHEKLFIDPNWNMGKPLFTNKELDYKNELINYWGIQTEDSIYFAPPDQDLYSN